MQNTLTKQKKLFKQCLDELIFWESKILTLDEETRLNILVCQFLDTIAEEFEPLEEEEEEDY